MAAGLANYIKREPMTFGFGALTLLAIAAAAMGVRRLTRDGPKWVRILLGLFAVFIVGGVMAAVRPYFDRVAFEADDDYAWSQSLKAITARYPAMKDVLELNPDILGDMRAELMPIIRQYQRNTTDLAYLEAVAAGSQKVMAARVLPVAAQGVDEAVAAWGAATVSLALMIKGVSEEACADFLMTGINRLPPNAEFDEALTKGHRAIVAAYKSSDGKDRRPSQVDLAAAYAWARSLAKPPFSEADLAALDDLGHQTKVRQCELLTRLLVAIDRLPVPIKAMIFRTLLAG